MYRSSYICCTLLHAIKTIIRWKRHRLKKAKLARICLCLFWPCACLLLSLCRLAPICVAFAWCFVLTTCLSKWKTIWMFNSNRSLVHIERSPIVRHGLNIWHQPSLRDNSWADVSLTKKAIIWHNHQSTAWLIKRQRRDISIEALRARENWLLAPKLSWDPQK